MIEAWCPGCRRKRSIPKDARPAEMQCARCSSYLTVVPSEGERRRNGLAAVEGPKRKAPPKSRTPKIGETSQEQRDKVEAIGRCLACGVEASEYVAIDPAHLTPRVGCGDPDCVVPLCRMSGGRGCHRLFDDGKLDLLVILTTRWPAEKAEVQHMLEHQAPVQACSQLAGAKMEWEAKAA